MSRCAASIGDLSLTSQTWLRIMFRQVDVLRTSAGASRAGLRAELKECTGALCSGVLHLQDPWFFKPSLGIDALFPRRQALTRWGGALLELAHFRQGEDSFTMIDTVRASNNTLVPKQGVPPPQPAWDPSAAEWLEMLPA